MISVDGVDAVAHALLQTMQQEIQQQGAVLAKLKHAQQQHAQQQHAQQQQPVVHAALAMSSVSFPSAAPASELTAHPGDVLQVLSHAPTSCTAFHSFTLCQIGNSQVVLPAGITPGVYNVRQVGGSVELEAVQQ